jgi:pimeloyl-ACP methyl ester carboxylesterase
MILVYVLLGIIFLIVLLIFYLRHQSFKITPEGSNWFKIKSSNRFYKAYLIHEKPSAGRVVLFLHGWNGNNATWKKDNDFIDETANLEQDFDVWNLYFSARLYGDIFRYVKTELKEAINVINEKRHFQLGKEIVIVAHSTGGVIARTFIKEPTTKDFAEKYIDTVILLATPNHGLELFDKYFKLTWLSHSLFNPVNIPVIGWFISFIGSILQALFIFIVGKLGRIILNSKSSEQLIPGSDFLNKLNSPADQLLSKEIVWKNAWGTDDDLVGHSGSFNISEVSHLDEMNPSDDNAFLNDFVSENKLFYQKSFDCDHAGFELPDNALQALQLESMDKPRPITGSKEVFEWMMDGITSIAPSEERLRCQHCKTIIDDPNTLICPGCGNSLAFSQKPE